ncbi:SDR family oxidoreductase (plasmid) [Burkholderia sp. JSH-S8]|nr:SDR family oxidoreductase [Burkholderia sp. JSH-S8]
MDRAALKSGLTAGKRGNRGPDAKRIGAAWPRARIRHPALHAGGWGCDAGTAVWAHRQHPFDRVARLRRWRIVRRSEGGDRGHVACRRDRKGAARHHLDCVAPGLIAAGMTLGVPKDCQEAGVARTPMERNGAPEEVAYAIAFFTSPRASVVTGQALFVCGGLSIGF